jgi:ankyrin repeat protein
MKKEDRALLAAAIAGNVEGVKAAIAANADVNAHDADGSALECAAFYGHVDVVRVLLTAGADPHAADGDALRHAATYGHAEIARLLLATSPDLHADDHVALRVAARYGHADVVRVLLAAGVDVHAHGEYALFVAADNERTEVVRILLAAGADPVVLWLTADKEVRARMLPTLDACADAMTPAQRSVLAKQSKQWVRLCVIADSAQKHQVLCR